MRLRATVLALTGLGLLAFSREPTRGAEAPLFKLPPLDALYPLPPVPTRSDRNANYTIEARLLPETHMIEGSLRLEWRNTSDTALSSFPFHLYWNAFRNNLSTSARGPGRRAARPEGDGDRPFGYTRVRSIRLLGGQAEDLLPSLRYIQPDDGNPEDRTVMEVSTKNPLPPGATARFAIEMSFNPTVTEEVWSSGGLSFGSDPWIANPRTSALSRVQSNEKAAASTRPPVAVSTVLTMRTRTRS